MAALGVAGDAAGVFHGAGEIGEAGSTAARLSKANGGIKLATGAGSKSAPAKIVRILTKSDKRTEVINLLKQLTYEDGVEHAVVLLKNGEVAIVSGGHTGITFPEGMITKIYGHTHPYDLLSQGPSDADRAALRALGQSSSRLLEKGLRSKFTAH